MRLAANLLAFASVFLLGVLGGFAYVSKMIGSLSLDVRLTMPTRLTLVASMLCLVVSIFVRSIANREA